VSGPAPVADVVALQRLVARYCHTLDDGDFDAFETLWAPDAEFVLRGETVRGAGAVRADLEARQPPERRGRHLTHNLVVDVDGDRASLRSDFQFLGRDREGRPRLVFLGRYLDEAVRTDGTWRFARREIEFF